MHYKEKIPSPVVLGPVFKILALIFVVSPLFLAAAYFLNEKATRASNPRWFETGVIAGAVLIILVVTDAWRAYRRGWHKLSAYVAFIEIAIGILVVTSINLSTTSNEQAYRPLFSLPLVIAAFMGDEIMIFLTWTLSVSAMAYYSFRNSSDLTSAGEQLFIWALFWALLSLIIHMIMKSQIKSIRVYQEVSELARSLADAGDVSELEVSLKHAGKSLNAESLAVFSRTPAGELNFIACYPASKVPEIDYEAAKFVLETKGSTEGPGWKAVFLTGATSNPAGLFVTHSNKTLSRTFLSFFDKNFRQKDLDPAVLSIATRLFSDYLERIEYYKITNWQLVTDPLTQLGNRRLLEASLNQEISRAQRYGTDLSVMMLDLDNFKKYNDTYGHIEGDAYLRSFGKVIRENIRSQDIAIRYGGEEFLLILPDTDVKSAIILFDKLKEKWKVAVHPGGFGFSAGIAEYESQISAKELARRADKALYYSKATGKNKATLYNELMPEEISVSG
jgi:diguanylate cyclase (GGDEF)-like protein